MPKAPRITTSFSVELHDMLRAWGAERGLHAPAEVLRAFVAAHGQGRCADVQAMAFAAAREQVLAELRQEGREILAMAAQHLRRK